MIEIDRKDALYKYLTNLGVHDVDSLYKELAENGRYKREDVQLYFRSKLRPSATNDIDESELERIIDYYADIKKSKPKRISKKELDSLLKTYKETLDKQIKDRILTSKLMDLMLMCVNYHTFHKDVDIQDLIQVANLGLLEALENYKVDAKIDFNDYIVYWVREKIIQEFEEKKNG